MNTISKLMINGTCSTLFGSKGEIITEFWQHRQVYVWKCSWKWCKLSMADGCVSGARWLWAHLSVWDHCLSRLRVTCHFVTTEGSWVQGLVQMGERQEDKNDGDKILDKIFQLSRLSCSCCSGHKFVLVFTLLIQTLIGLSLKKSPKHYNCMLAVHIVWG